MGYTWTDGDLITADRLNNTGGGGFAIVSLSATGFSSASRTFALIVYARQVNGNWVVQNDYDTTWVDIGGYANDVTWDFIPPQYTMISSDGSMYPFLVYLGQGIYISTTGDISDTYETLYFSYGSTIQGGGYRISGNGSIQFVAE